MMKWLYPPMGSKVVNLIQSKKRSFPEGGGRKDNLLFSDLKRRAKARIDSMQ